jgi:hypothetical protein
LEEAREEAATALRDSVELHAKRLLTQIGTLAATALYIGSGQSLHKRSGQTP